MAKGFIRGVLWGSSVSLSAVVLVSIFSNEPFKRAALQDAVDTTQGALSEIARQEPEIAAPAETAPSIAALPPPASEPDTLSGLSETVQESAAVPQTGVAPDLDQPLAGLIGQNGVSARQADTPVAGSAQQATLAVPETDSADAVSTSPASPPKEKTPSEDGAPQVQTEITALTPPAEADVSALTAPAAGIGSISADPAQPQAPDVPAQTSAFPQTSGVAESVSSDPAQPVQPKVEETAVDTLKTPGVAAQTPTPQAVKKIEPEARDPANPSTQTQIARLDTQTAQTPSAQTDVQATKEPRALPTTTPTEPQPESTPPQQAKIIKPAPLEPDTAAEFTPPPEDQGASAAPPKDQTVARAQEQTKDVTTNRLPRVGAQPIIPEPDVPVEDVETAPQIISMKPIEEFAEPVENPDGKPVMAIVLMDSGVDLSGDTIGLPALRSFPYPLTFAVDFSLPDAQARSDAYRAEGFEVMAMVDLPEGADARDAETNLAVALQSVPEAVGVLEGTRTGVQSSRDAAQQVASILASSGHGFVTQNKGLNTVQKLAARNGVPSAVVFRDFDSADQTPTVIRRFLDQAAFRADQEDGVVMLGRLRADTISALITWGLQDRASKVALVPVSGALKTQ